MKRLRVPPLGEKQNPFTTFRVGLFSGIFIVLVAVTIVAGIVTAKEHEGDWQPALKMFRVNVIPLFGPILVFILGIFALVLKSGRGSLATTTYVLGIFSDAIMVPAQFTFAILCVLQVSGCISVPLGIAKLILAGATAFFGFMYFGIIVYLLILLDKKRKGKIAIVPAPIPAKPAPTIPPIVQPVPVPVPVPAPVPIPAPVPQPLPPLPLVPPAFPPARPPFLPPPAYPPAFRPGPAFNPYSPYGPPPLPAPRPNPFYGPPLGGIPRYGPPPAPPMFRPQPFGRPGFYGGRY
ncbi:hypothetical protein HELRODRAFT_193654 [Helobdella robusta]|uniref:Uncharacterized protein n=1 Tax=Helobdella robusta TaxID=6412 RepID=T1FV83_HELRO|nr:hypothetical protein HELRODRAFT_193654 [Helobdella robusta]ESN95149.1 hypothetical protein HELRODRAFT_193654 [Helobdella robusta]